MQRYNAKLRYIKFKKNNNRNKMEDESVKMDTFDMIEMDSREYE